MDERLFWMQRGHRQRVALAVLALHTWPYSSADIDLRPVHLADHPTSSFRPLTSSPSYFWFRVHAATRGSPTRPPRLQPCFRPPSTPQTKPYLKKFPVTNSFPFSSEVLPHFRQNGEWLGTQHWSNLTYARVDNKQVVVRLGGHTPSYAPTSYSILSRHIG